MKRAKRIVSLLLAIAVSMSVLTTEALLSATENDNGNITESVTADEGNLTISDNSDTSLKIDGRLLSISNDITIVYVVKKEPFDNAGYADPYLEARTEKKTVKIEGKEEQIEGNNCYVFAFEKIAPQMMNDTVYTVLWATKDNELYSSQTETYSVADYAYSMLNKTEDAYLKTLLVDMLNYGAAAQIYQKYNTSNLANSQLTEEQKQFGTESLRELTTVKAITGNNTDSEVAWAGIGLHISNKVSIIGYFTAETINDVYIKITDSENAVLDIISAENFKQTEDPQGMTVHYIVFEGLNAAQMSETVKLTACDSSGNSISKTYVYSIESYAYTAKDSENTELAELVAAMMKYGDASRAYVNSRDADLATMTQVDFGDVLCARIINAETKTALATEGDNGQLAKTSNSINQIWRFEKNIDGSYKIINSQDNKVLAANNGQIVIATDNGTSSQKWKIYKKEDKYVLNSYYYNNYVLKAEAANAGTAVDMSDYIKDDSSNGFDIVELSFKDGTENVIWYTTPAIPADAGEIIDLSTYNIQFKSNGNLQLAKDISWSSDELDITDKKVTVPAKGVYKLLAKTDTSEKTIYIVAKEPTETEYVLYYNDFSNSDVSDFKTVDGSGTLEVNNGRLIINGTKRVLLPEFIGDFGNYTIDTDATIISATEKTRWMALMNRVQDQNQPYYQFLVRQGANASNGVEFSEMDINGEWQYEGKTAFSEEISSAKLYSFKLMVYDNIARGEINSDIILYSTTHTAYQVGNIGIQTDKCTAAFDYFKVTLNFNIAYDYSRLAQLYIKEKADLGEAFYAQILETKEAKSLVVNEADNVVIGAASKEADQIWQFVKQENGSYTIRNMGNNSYLTTKYSSTETNNNVLISSYEGADGQYWDIYKIGEKYNLVPVSAYDMVLDVAGGATENGTNIQLWTYNDDDDDAKRFEIAEVDITGTDVTTFSEIYNAGIQTATEEKLALLDRYAEEYKENTINSASEYSVSGSAKVYYFSQNGNDNYSGTTQRRPKKTLSALSKLSLNSGDVVLFERGSMFRGTITAKSGVTYSAYGTGSKPIICGSLMNYANESYWQETSYPNVYVCTKAINNAGNMVFDNTWVLGDYTQTLGTLKVLNLDGFTGVWDLCNDLEFHCDLDNDKLYLYSTEGNPGKRFDTIDICEEGDLFDVTNVKNVVVDNIHFTLGGTHGIGAVNANYLTVRNCIFNWIGGAVQYGTVRFGNAVESYVASDHFYVYNNWIYQIYDTGITTQFNENPQDKENIMQNNTYYNNLIEYTFWAFEYFHHPTEGGIRITRDIYVHDNYCRMSGKGWGRPGAGHMCCFAPSGETVENVVIENNVFDRGFAFLVSTYSADASDLTYNENVYVQDEGELLAFINSTTHYMDDNAYDTVIDLIGDKAACVLKAT